MQQSTSRAAVDLTNELFKSHPPAFPYLIVLTTGRRKKNEKMKKWKNGKKENEKKMKK